MSGGLDARSLQDMRERAEAADEFFAGAWPAARTAAHELARDVLVLLDERERLEASLRDALDALGATPLDTIRRYRGMIDGEWGPPVSPYDIAADEELSAWLDRLARLTVGERASLDSPEAQQ